MRGFPLDLLQHLFGVRVVARYSDCGYERALPEIVIIDFGDGDIEFTAEPVLQTLNGMTLVFERMRSVQVKFQR